MNRKYLSPLPATFTNEARLNSRKTRQKDNLAILNIIDKSKSLQKSGKVNEALELCKNALPQYMAVEYLDPSSKQNKLKLDLLCELYYEIAISYYLQGNEKNAFPYFINCYEIYIRSRVLTKTSKGIIRERKSKESEDTTWKKIYKLIMLGDLSKTEIRNTMFDGFKKSYINATGADFAIKRVQTPKGEEIVIQIWDISNNPRFERVRNGYLMHAKCVLLVFDITNPNSLYQIPDWIKDFIQHDKSWNDFTIVPMVLIGNKVHLRDETKSHVSYTEGYNYAVTLSNRSALEVPYIEISTKTHEGEKELLEYLKNFEEYYSLLTDFTYGERKQIVLAQSLYERIKMVKQETPSLEDMVNYMNNYTEIIPTESTDFSTQPFFND